MADPYFGAYEYQAQEKKIATQKRSLANQQAALLGKQRGTRKIADITKQYTEGFQPLMAQYGSRGLAGPNVASGIQRSALERYAAQMQEGIGSEQMALQDQLNQIALDEANSQASLESYLADLARQKQQDIIDTATTLKGLGSY